MLSWFLSKSAQAIDTPAHILLNKLHVIFFVLACYQLFLPIIDEKIKKEQFNKTSATMEGKASPSVFRFFD
jgi:hypothetical protein